MVCLLANPRTGPKSFDTGNEQTRREQPRGREALPVYSDSFCLKICSVDDSLEEDEEPELTEYEGVQMDSRIVPALEALLQAADEAGCPMKVTSGYVSPDEQNELYEKEVQRLMKEEKLSQVMAERQAEKTVPKGGCSEGQTGMTVTVARRMIRVRILKKQRPIIFWCGMRPITDLCSVIRKAAK